MAAPKTSTEMLLSHEHGLTKSYTQYDSADRPFRVYTAVTNAANGDNCLVTEYIYRDAVSTQVKGVKEGYGTWDSSAIPDSAFSGVPAYAPGLG